MFIKLTLICLAIVPLIIGEESENPTPSAPTRVGKFFGWLAVRNNFPASLKLLINANTLKKGELSLSFGRGPIITSADYPGLHRLRLNQNVPSLQNFNVVASLTSSDSDTSNATLDSGTHDDESAEETALHSTTEALQETSRTLKLEDYEEITFDPDVDGNREKREATSDENVNNRGLRADDDDGIVSTTTTVESSTIPVKSEEQESSENSFVTMSPPSVAQQDFYHSPPVSHNHYYPYLPSSNPSAQYVSITNPPHHQPHQPYLPPVNNYYDFYPSQLDYHHHGGYSMPYCNPSNPVNPINHKFTPNIHAAWSNYRKWK